MRRRPTIFLVAIVLVLSAVGVTRCRTQDQARLSVYDRATGRVLAESRLGVGWVEAVWGDRTGVMVAACNPLSWITVDESTGAVLARDPYNGSRTGGGENGLLPRWPVNTKESSAITVLTPAPPLGGITEAVGSNELVWDGNVQRIVSVAGWSVAAPRARGKNVVFLVTADKIYLVWNATTDGCPSSG